MQTWPQRLSSLLLCSALFACQQTLPDQTEEAALPTADIQADSTQPSNFVLAVKMANVAKEALDQKLAPLGVKARSGIDIYRVYYMTTNIDGKPVKATGVVMVPMIRIPVFPWISIQHLTITGEAQAPSNKPDEGVFESSQGFITVIPDQIGFGATTGTIHPYLFKNAYPKVVVDMLRAARTFIAANGLTVGPLFLRGYSEGGYATMALQKAIETQYASEFNLVASAPGAGPYELEGTAVKSMALPQINPVNFSMVLLSYQKYLAPTMDLSKIFAVNPDDVKKALNGSKVYEEAVASLPMTPTGLLKQEFIADFTQQVPTSAEAGTLRKLLAENSLFNDGWAPKTPTKLYHCMDDEVVPELLTEYAMGKIMTLAPTAPVTKVTLASPDPSKPYRHATCPLYYAHLSWFGEVFTAWQAKAGAGASAALMGEEEGE